LANFALNSHIFSKFALSSVDQPATWKRSNTASRGQWV